ncbi:MAG: DUF4173 domain-containing protein, partial [Gemmatimonadetes bacterium]|nr:DUF4173 domain-containing protein [Gemmatimonadota bacterium]
MEPDTRPATSTHEPAAAVLETPAYPAPMGPAIRGALGVMGGAAALGVLGDALLRVTPWGINLTLWTLALVVAALGLRRWTGLDSAGRTWMPMALLIALLMAWRDSPTLKGLDIAALCIVVALAMHRARGARLRTAGVVSHLAGIGRGAFDTITGLPVLVLNDVRWGEVSRGRGAKHLLPLLRGLALALPVLGVFAALLVSADAAFEGMMNRVFQLDGPVLASHLFLGGVFAWISAGALRSLALADESEAGTELPMPGPFLGVVEVGVVLGLLNALFFAFVAVQLPYLFSTASKVGGEAGPGYAQYARRGFFELVWVAGLVLPLLLGLHAAMRRSRPGDERVFRWLAGVQVALLFVIIASALHRMRLYQNAFGLTELRLYTTAFMFWLAAVFGWFCATVLRGRRERFTFGALVMAGEALVILHAVNPDARIVHTNAARATAERPFDAQYASGLSA